MDGELGVVVSFQTLDETAQCRNDGDEDEWPGRGVGADAEGVPGPAFAVCARQEHDILYRVDKTVLR